MVSSEKPRVVIPCYGDRLFRLTQNWEIVFPFSFEMAEIVEG